MKWLPVTFVKLEICSILNFNFSFKYNVKPILRDFKHCFIMEILFNGQFRVGNKKK